MNMIVSAAAISTASATATRVEPRYEPAAILPRAQLAIEASRRSAQVWGWQVDEEGASRALAFWQQEASNGGEGDVPDEVMGFHIQHGHSIDWLVTGDPKGMLTMLARQSDRARATAVAGQDPIFAAIEHHKHALHASDTAVEISSALWDDTPEHIEAEKVTEEARSVLDDAGLDLATAPTTIAGVVALLTYLAECTVGDDFDGGNWKLPHIVSAEDGGEPAPRVGMLDDEEHDEHFMRYVLRSLAAKLEEIGGAA